MSVLANVVRIDMITDETVPQLITAETGDEVSVDPIVSEGSREILRSKNMILAQNNYEDIVVGYKIGVKDAAFNPEQFAIIDGGTYTAVAEPVGYHYDGPAVGSVVSRMPVTLDVWTEEKDADGATMGYQRFRFPKTKGKPVKFSHKDGKFFAPEYDLESRALKTQKPLLIDWFDELPTGTAAERLAAVNE